MMVFFRSVTKQGFVLGVLLLVVFVLVAGSNEQSIHQSYTNTMYGFSLNPLVRWHSVENESSDVAVRFYPINDSNVSLRITSPFGVF
jgi:hypothetical protein